MIFQFFPVYFALTVPVKLSEKSYIDFYALVMLTSSRADAERYSRNHADFITLLAPTLI